MNDSNISKSFKPLILLMKKGLLPRFFLDRKKKTCIHAYFSFLEIENTSASIKFFGFILNEFVKFESDLILSR